jgi:hypothetical protein
MKCEFALVVPDNSESESGRNSIIISIQVNHISENLLNEREILQTESEDEVSKRTNGKFLLSSLVLG